MPRNRSEKLPRCPEAHSYAHAVDLYFACGMDRTPLPNLWRRVPEDVKEKLRRQAPIRDYVGYRTMSEYDDIWRKHMARNIREQYAP